MPLASRATQARAARTNPDETPPSGSEAPAGTVKDSVQPRRGKPAVAPPEPPQTPDDDGRGDVAPPPPPPDKAPRKPRTPRTAPAAAEPGSGQPIDVKALKARQKVIEQEFKRLAGAEKIAMRELAATYKTQRQALEGEHRLISNQLSAAVFSG
jgi:hypothetical protein